MIKFKKTFVWLPVKLNHTYAGLPVLFAWLTTVYKVSNNGVVFYSGRVPPYSKSI